MNTIFCLFMYFLSHKRIFTLFQTSTRKVALQISFEKKTFNYQFLNKFISHAVMLIKKHHFRFNLPWYTTLFLIVRFYFNIFVSLLNLCIWTLLKCSNLMSQVKYKYITLRLSDVWISSLYLHHYHDHHNHNHFVFVMYDYNVICLMYYDPYLWLHIYVRCMYLYLTCIRNVSKYHYMLWAMRYSLSIAKVFHPYFSLIHCYSPLYFPVSIGFISLNPTLLKHRI